MNTSLDILSYTYGKTFEGKNFYDFQDFSTVNALLASLLAIGIHYQ